MNLRAEMRTRCGWKRKLYPDLCRGGHSLEVDSELDLDFAVRIGPRVTVSKGALGSVWLAIDSHRAKRVTQIRSSKSGYAGG